MANIPNTFQRIDASPVLPETVNITATETEFACKRLLPAGTIQKKTSYEQEIRGYLTTGTTIGGMVFRTYLNSQILIASANLAITANLLLTAPSGFRLNILFDVYEDGTINVQGDGVLSIAGAMTNIIMPTTSFVTVDRTVDNLLRNTVQGTGAMVGASKLFVRMNQLRSTF